MTEHPVVEEYVKTYDIIVNFKDVLAKIFFERGINTELFVSKTQLQTCKMSFWVFVDCTCH